MNNKKQNFNLINNLENIFKPEFKNNIWLITHFSNLNTAENNLIKIFCESNSIKSKYIKINLLKRIVKSSLFFNLLSGPTRLFFYSDFLNFLNFFNSPLIKKKLIPLAIFFNNNFYSYNFFYTYLKNLNKLTNLTTLQNSIILFLYNQNKHLIVKFNNFLLGFIKLLSFYTSLNK